MSAKREIRVLSPSPSVLHDMRRIGVACFGAAYEGNLLDRNWQQSDPRSVFYGCFEGERLIAYNGFLAHQARFGSEDDLLYQSCHSATDPEFRGQGLFSSIIDHAKQNLPGRYIIGFPNNQSGPIFVGRLGFKSTPLVRVWLPCSFSGALVRSGRPAARVIRPSQRHIAEWKARENVAPVVMHEEEGNFIWGRVESRKVRGIRLSFFNAGGGTIGNPAALPHTLRRLGREHGVSAIRFVCTPQSSAVQHSRLVLHGKNTEPLIWYPLNGSTPDVDFEAYAGMKDVW